MSMMNPPLPLAPMSEGLFTKAERLRALLRGLDHAVLAYSGGVDSAFLLHAAHEALGDRLLAVTARSPSLMEDELDAATTLARRLGARHEIVETHELDRQGYTANGADRCYHCKSELFDAASVIGARIGGAVLLDGFNADDLLDHRPGHRAAAEHQVRHPLAEVGLTKAEIRTLSRAAGLPTWSKPQLACLSSRIPYGTEVTKERLGRIERVEQHLRQLGFFDVRARLVKGDDAFLRLELGEAELVRAVDPHIRASIIRVARAAGFGFVTLDLEGFRSGRLNEGLPVIERPG